MSVVGGDAQFKKSIGQRICEMLAYINGGAGGFLINGDVLTITASAIAPVVGTTGIFTRISTATTARVDGDLQYNRQRNIAFHARFKLSSTSSSQIFIGVTDKSGLTMISGSLPTGDYAGIYLPAGSSTWRFVHSNGGSGTVITGSSSDTDIHDFYMWLQQSGGGNKVIFQLDSNDRVEATSNIPSTSALLRMSCGLRGIGSTKSLDIAKVTVIQEA